MRHVLAPARPCRRSISRSPTALRKGLGDAALRSLVADGWLSPRAVVVLEEAERATVAIPDGLTLLDKRSYGDTQVLFLQAP